MAITRPSSGLIGEIYLDTGVTLTSGAISSVADQSGSGYTWTQPTSGKRPTPVTSADGFPSMALNGSQFLLFNGPIDFQNLTVLIAVKQSYGSSGMILVGAPADALQFYIDQSLSLNTGRTAFRTGSAVRYGGNGNSKRRQLYFFRSSPTVALPGFGTLEDPYSASALPAGTATGFALGATYAGSSGLIGEIAGALIYSGGLSNVDMFLARTALTRRTSIGAATGTLIICDGTSRTYGTGTTHEGCWPAQLRDYMQGNPMVVNFGVPGQTLTQMLADFDTQIAPLVSAGDFTQVFLVCEGGYNDTAGTNAQMQASITSYGAKVAALSAPGVKITRILCTNAPGVNADNTKLATDNAWRRLNYKAIGFDFLADLASDPRLSDYSNTTFVSPDQIHNNDAGSSVIVENVIDCLKPVNADVRSGVSNGFGPVGMLDLPAVGNVRSGITFDGATKTGTLDITADNPPPAIGLTRGFGS